MGFVIITFRNNGNEIPAKTKMKVVIGDNSITNGKTVTTTSNNVLKKNLPMRKNDSFNKTIIFASGNTFIAVTDNNVITIDNAKNALVT